MKTFRTISIICIIALMAACLTSAACAENNSGTFEIIELTPDSLITRDGDYTVSGLFTDILTDSSVDQGWFYYFSVGTDDVVPYEEWKCAPGMYTSCELLFDLQNLRDPMEKTFIERFSGFILSNADPGQIPQCGSAAEYLDALRTAAAGDSEAEIFELTALQRNPGQLDTDGYETRSKDAVLLGCGETAQQNLIADVSRAFYESWADSSRTEPMWAVFSYGDAVFIVDLRLYMVEA